MKLLFAAATALTLFFTGIVGLTSPPKPTVASLHAFEEPLIAIGGDSSSNQDSALIAALQIYQQRKSYEDVSAITNYLDANPQSPWKFSLLANLGIIYRKTGHFSKAVDAWEQAWALGKGEKNVQVAALANHVAGELALLVSSLGRTERLAPLLAEIKGRAIYGSASAQLMYASENLRKMKERPGESFKCGPYALGSIRTITHTTGPDDRLITSAQSSVKGFSLTQVRDLSSALKMNYQMAKRQPGASFIIPSVAHWKSGHYAALLKKDGDQYLTIDPTFGQQLLVTSQALEEESSGYFLVPTGPLPTGWQAVSESEGDKVWGRGRVTGTTPSATTPIDTATPPKCPVGMAAYKVFLMLVSMSISDTPVGYTPPVGPDAKATVTYNQLEYGQPSTFSFTNFGPCWVCDWLSYIAVPTSTGAPITVAIRGGGEENYTTYTSVGGTYLGYYSGQIQSQATLWVKAPVSPSTYNTYERRMPDGSKEVFSQGTSSSSPVDVFLTSIVDPKGNTMSLGYDTTSSYYTSTGNLRLTTVTDALGLVTTLTYGFSSDLTKVSQITDPYARSATFNYSSTSPYQLTSIVDVVGITSSFTYGSGSAITSMETPYGTTSFSFSWDGSYTDSGSRALTVTEPDTGQVKVEFDDGPNYPYYLGSLVTNGGSGYTSEPFPIWTDTNTSGHYGISSAAPGYIQYRNTYYWNKKSDA